jgi:hypothetical protein
LAHAIGHTLSDRHVGHMGVPALHLPPWLATGGDRSRGDRRGWQGAYQRAWVPSPRLVDSLKCCVTPSVR